MTALAETLEEVQVQILQGDLSKNPKLQPSSIPSKDKELKTTAKKIIPAINELLKHVNVLDNTVADYSTIVQTLVSYIDEKIQELESKINASGGEGGEAMKRVFREKIMIARNRTAKLPLKFTEIIDLQQQIVITEASELGKGNVLVDEPFVLTNDSSSIFKLYTMPADLRVHEDESITITNSGACTMYVYLYDLV